MFHLITYVLSFILISFAHLNAQHPELEKIYEFSGWEEHLLMGKGMLNAGDLDKDGFDEYVSYSPESNSVFLFRGAFPPDTLPTLTFFEMGETWPKSFFEVVLGNVSGDSIPELIVPYRGYDDETYIYSLSLDGDTLVDFILDYGGEQICCGDINNDGYDDIIICDPDASYFFSGRVHIYLGREELSSEPDYIIIGDSSDFRLGMNCTTGDLNGDDYDDLIVFGNNINIHSGFDYIRVYYGSAQFDTIFDVQIDDPCLYPESQGFNRVMVCFDYNQDGFDDLITNGLYVYNGSAVFDTIPEYHFIWPGDGLNTYGGGRLYNVGDINKDGYPDLGIGQTSMFGGKGIAHIKMGDKYGLDDDYIYIEPVYGQGFGYALISAGDINGDNVSDVIIGEPYYILTHGYGKHNFYAGDSSLRPYVKDTVTTIKQKSETPLSFFQLHQNYPNPFNASTRISYDIEFAGEVRLRIYDIKGCLVSEFCRRPTTAGRYSIIWEGKNQNGVFVSSGLYFYSLSFQNRFLIKKLVYLK